VSGQRDAEYRTKTKTLKKTAQSKHIDTPPRAMIGAEKRREKVFSSSTKKVPKANKTLVCARQIQIEGNKRRQSTAQQAGINNSSETRVRLENS
jgi:hypothetical protein